MCGRLPLSTLVVCLLIGLAGALVVKAQIQDLSGRSSRLESRNVIALPDDEGNDEGCDELAASAPVSATGQLRCFYNGYHDLCYSTGVDAEYRMGVTSVPRFTTQPDGTIIDELTGLTWLRSADCFGERAWRDALADAMILAHGLCALTDGSAPGDWRLPNIRELLSLVDYGRELPALPPDHPFSGVQPGAYWSSSSKADSDLDAWRVDFAAGTSELADAAQFAGVLATRGGVPPEHYVCDAALTSCDCTPPACPPGEVPSVVSECWGPCVSISDCLPW